MAEADPTRVVERKIDPHGEHSWESIFTLESNKVRAEAQVPPHLPGIVIFVHGVNSEGEWYEDAEAALLAGLNARLGRQDLKPNQYHTTPASVQHQVEVQGYSPVIRFYWGYRAPDGHEKDYLIPLRDKQENSVWIKEDEGKWQSPQYWGGGPFQNGTNNLQQLWQKWGFKRRAWAGPVPVNVQSINPEWDRQLQDAPPREYYAHAANRLAKLIDKIRTQYPRDTVTIMSHSQGTMIAMAASLLCKTRAPDAVILMNSPYALEDKVTDSMTSGNYRPTNQARINTFVNLLQRVDKDKKPLTPADLDDLRVGATADKKRWTPDISLPATQGSVPERDNHGRIYVYCNPHDRVMGSTALQSIGWQGVSSGIVQAHGTVLKQRMLARDTPCGDAPGPKPFGTLPDMQMTDPKTGKTKPFWDGNRKVVGMDLWATPDPRQTVLVNAEAVPQPLRPDELSSFDEARLQDENKADKLRKLFKQEDDFKYFKAIYQREQWREEDNPYAEVPGQDKIRRLETQEEMEQRISNYIPEPTDHSSLPGNQAFMERVVAYDLPIGFCDSTSDAAFWKELRREADWLSGADAYYAKGVLDVPKMPVGIDRETVQDEMDNPYRNG
jgi:pimeloyl-ACP methyl ester carboxylesterase